MTGDRERNADFQLPTSNFQLLTSNLEPFDAVQGRLRTSNPVGAALVYGAGIAGIQAALDLADSGIKVYLVDQDISIGGKMARLDKTFPTNDCATCIIAPKLVETGRHPNIEIITQAQIDRVSGEAGHFQVGLHQTPRYVRPELCNGCGDCAAACPVVVPNRFDQGLSTRKAIYRHTPQAVPNAFAIEKRGISPCRDACPAHQRAQGYVALIQERRFAEAYRVIKEDNPFPSICGRVCNHRCEEACSRNLLDAPVSIMVLKRFVADWMAAERQSGRVAPVRPVDLPPDAPRVAIIGSGPAGLTAAQNLVLAGYKVTVFEALPVAGGMMRVGIPEYRLPSEVLQWDIDEILALGVELKLNSRVDDLDKLFAEGYQAVFLAVGAHSGRKLPIPGADLPGVLVNTEFLQAARLGKPMPVGKKALVLGGGNVAMDCARTAHRLGAEEVHIACLESREQMPARPLEIEEAEEEGIVIHPSNTFLRVMEKDSKVAGVECQRVNFRGFEADGRPDMDLLPDTQHVIWADTVIFSIGQRPDLDWLEGVEQTRFRTIAVDPETLATSRPGVFAGGDAVTGTTWVIDAIAAGHKAALSIDNYLRGLRDEVPRPQPVYQPVVKLTREEALLKVERGDTILRERAKSKVIPVAERWTNPFAEYDWGLTEEQAVAEAERCLSCGLCSECLECVYACGMKAIDHDMFPRPIELDVGAIILAPGFDLFEAQGMGEYGYGLYPNVITSLEFERILSASGPYQGHIRRLSDGAEPRRIAFIQCVGSRNLAQGNDYCSAVCCMYATKEAIVAREHLPDLEATIFYIDLRAFGKGFYRYYERARDEYGVRYIRSMISSVKERQQTNNLLLKYVGEDGRVCEEEFDLVVLSVGLKPSDRVAELCDRLGIAVNGHGFCATQPFSPVETSRPGIYACGTFTGPKDIPQTVMEASAAAAGAEQLLSPARGKLVREREFPQERDVAGQEPRIGAFICHCGTNIGSVVDVPEVVEFARSLPGVVVAEDNLHVCAPDVQARMKELIEEHNLNRVFVASCSPRTHEPLFQETLQETGLNKYLFEMANIRDQCSWVHMRQPDRATEKAKDLVRMGLNRAQYLAPLYSTKLDINHQALVIGGGLAGMTAARALSGQGFEVYLVEKESELGGNLRHLHYTLEGNSVQEYLADLIEQVQQDPLIHVYTGARLERVDGCIGNFTAEVSEVPEVTKVESGVVIVATGAQEHKPSEYLYGSDSRVLTQRELEERLATKDYPTKDHQTIVMIQCVGSRDEERPYCSRICCSQALKNALKLKEINPDTEIYVLYRDLMSYGLKEEYYTRARQAGVKFIRYEVPEVMEVSKVTEVGSGASNLELRTLGTSGTLMVSVVDANLRRPLDIPADLVVLSVPTVAPRENEALAQTLKVPLDEDGFFLEAHMKLRPVDFATDGIFVCGLAHGPKFMEETIAQAQAAAGRAATILSQTQIESEAMLPVVDLEKCIGCAVCESTCAFSAIKVGETEKGSKAQVILAACKGCGACGAACPQMANMPGHFTDRQLMAQINALAEVPRISRNGFEPKVLGFLCNWCAYAGADLAGVSRIQYQPNFHVVRVMCTGRIDPVFVIEAFLRGIDGVMVLGCHPGDCHYSEGNLRAQERMSYLRRVLERVGLDPARFRLDWISASEGRHFAELVDEFTEQVRGLGPVV
ncbi:MAG: FAD-dependent oxidoreductase [Anaerolineae bacterium]